MRQFDDFLNFPYVLYLCGFRSLKSRVKILVDGTLLIPNLIPEDAGNYTCTPTNGILTPPSASAHLKVKRKGFVYYTSVFRNPADVGAFPSRPWVKLHLVINSSSFTSDPARVGRMPRETYLPAGMEGVIVCPVQADPPVLYVNWTKDGNNLNLDNVRRSKRRL